MPAVLHIDDRRWTDGLPAGRRARPCRALRAAARAVARPRPRRGIRPAAERDRPSSAAGSWTEPAGAPSAARGFNHHRRRRPRPAADRPAPICPAATRSGTCRAARYRVQVTRSGYLPLDYGQRRPGELGRPVELADGQVHRAVDFALPRMSVITGQSAMKPASRWKA